MLWGNSSFPWENLENFRWRRQHFTGWYCWWSKEIRQSSGNMWNTGVNCEKRGNYFAHTRGRFPGYLTVIYVWDLWTMDTIIHIHWWNTSTLGILFCDFLGHLRCWHWRCHLKLESFHLHPRSLTARPWKITVGRRSFPFGFRPIFRGYVKLPGGISVCFKGKFPFKTLTALDRIPVENPWICPKVSAWRGTPFGGKHRAPVERIQHVKYGMQFSSFILFLLFCCQHHLIKTVYWMVDHGKSMILNHGGWILIFVSAMALSSRDSWM